MSDDVLKLFEGLDEKQVRLFRKNIMPTLQELRRQILNEQGENKQSIEEVIHNGKMSRQNQKRRRV